METAALWGLIALILAIVAALLGPGLARDLARALGGALPHAGRTSHLTPDERALRNPLLRALIDRALPRLVLERDGSGDDDEVPVWTSCRQAACARAGRAEPVLHVHVVHAAAGPGRASSGRTTPTRRPATSRWPRCAATTTTTGRACWSRSRRDGSLRGARASAHSGFNGTAPWWEQAADDWAPYGGVVYRASGSHALGFRRGDLDLAGDAWNGDLATVEPRAFRLVAADRVALRGLRFDPEVAPPWEKAAWRNPARATRAPAAPGRAAWPRRRACGRRRTRWAPGEAPSAYGVR